MEWRQKRILTLMDRGMRREVLGGGGKKSGYALRVGYSTDDTDEVMRDERVSIVDEKVRISMTIE
jgi:hypothetical protein